MPPSLSVPFGAPSPVLKGQFEIPQWHACTTRARHEKKVDALLTRNGIESYLPLVERESQWKDRRKLVAFAMFPGYVFARFALEGMLRVVSTHGVAGVVSVRGKPAPIGGDEIQNIRRLSEGLARSGAAADDAEELTTGIWVRVTSGPFEGLEGIVTGTRSQRRVRVGLQLIGRFMQVDVGMAHVKPIPAPARLPAAA
jgi:transcription antitermination factor NusG